MSFLRCEFSIFLNLYHIVWSGGIWEEVFESMLEVSQGEVFEDFQKKGEYELVVWVYGQSFWEPVTRFA